MSENSYINVEIESDVAVIYLNDPEARNALSEERSAELRNTLRSVQDSARAILITGKGKGFCAGAKLSSEVASSKEKLDLGAALRDCYNPLFHTIRALKVPLITAVNGPAAGIGGALALSGDLIVASKSAFFLQAFSRIGLVPDGAASYLTVKSVGRARAMEMALLDERMSSEKALEWGLINRVVEDDQLLSEALDIAKKLAKGPTKAYEAIRKQVWAACEISYAEQLETEANSQTYLGQTADHAEGVRAFLTREEPNFTGS